MGPRRLGLSAGSHNTSRLDTEPPSQGGFFVPVTETAMALDLPQPDICVSGQFRLKGALAAGTAIANSTNYQQVVNVRGAAKGRIWIKTATAGGTLKASAIQSVTTDDASPYLSPGEINPAKVTAITDGAPDDVTVTAGTVTHMDLTFNGESWYLVTLAGGGTGTVSFVEIALL